MVGLRLNLSVHESTDDIGPGRDDPGIAGRDSTQPRCTLRPSVARGAACGRGNELPAGSRGPWGFTWDGGKLGFSFREGRLRWAERAGGSRPTVTVGEGRDETSGGGSEEESRRLWIAGAALGRSAPIELPREEVWHRATRPAMPTAVSTTRVPSAQTPPESCSSRPASAGHRKKNSNAWRGEIRLSSGRWMKFIFSI